MGNGGSHPSRTNWPRLWERTRAGSWFRCSASERPTSRGVEPHPGKRVHQLAGLAEQGIGSNRLVFKNSPVKPFGKEHETMTKIAIVGPGAAGSYIGAFLTRAGHDVTLFDQWPEHVEVMRSQGLRASGSQEISWSGEGHAPPRPPERRRAVRHRFPVRQVLRTPSGPPTSSNLM